MVREEPRCRKCGNFMKGHPNPKGDDCNQTPLAGYPKSDPKSPSPLEVTQENTGSGHPSTSEASGSGKDGAPGGNGENASDTAAAQAQAVDDAIAVADARKKELQEKVKKLQQEAIMAEKQQTLVERNQEVAELENQILEMQLRLQVAKQSANLPSNPPAVLPLTRSASVSSIPSVPAKVTPAELNGSHQVLTGGHASQSSIIHHGSTPNLAAASASSLTGATLMAPLAETGRSSSVNLPCNDQPALNPYDIIRSNSAASAVAGLGAVPKQNVPSNDGKLPEHYVFRPGTTKVDVSDISFEEFCHGYGRMLQTMIGDTQATTRRLAYFVLITELAARHDWADVRDFHQMASLEVCYWSRRAWDDPFTDLHRYKFASSRSVGGASKENSKNKGGSNVAKSQSQGQGQSTPLVVCKNHNFKEQGCTFVGCNRKHVCFHCWRKNGSLNDGHKGKDCIHKPKE